MESNSNYIFSTNEKFENCSFLEGLLQSPALDDECHNLNLQSAQEHLDELSPIHTFWSTDDLSMDTYLNNFDDKNSNFDCSDYFSEANNTNGNSTLLTPTKSIKKNTNSLNKKSKKQLKTMKSNNFSDICESMNYESLSEISIFNEFNLYTYPLCFFNEALSSTNTLNTSFKINDAIECKKSESISSGIKMNTTSYTSPYKSKGLHSSHKPVEIITSNWVNAGNQLIELDDGDDLFYELMSN